MKHIAATKDTIRAWAALQLAAEGAIEGWLGFASDDNRVAMARAVKSANDELERLGLSAEEATKARDEFLDEWRARWAERKRPEKRGRRVA